MAEWFQRLYKRRFVRYGLPFLIVIVGGSYGLKYFAVVRYEFRKGKMITYEEGKKYGLQVKKKEDKPSLESEYLSLEQKDMDSWKNIRGPRPWEDSKSIQDEQRH
ncbi:cytochrome c oxidase assembly protein COX16 homolog, mitochondrial-like isoform X2 [Gigantopelta aegis]|uniref:cytochrome c oxidase assembly protein COX16 homolog, mitochondrial-like isoform X2 n=1 Tax=Gigantopelta aegis TaxID=1735272 RepID=UPI001B88D2AE|nr:cytochrome c oxidase assembly protein COX16 homolog, mitochondrial-like isoform X2 [Gigantopelta aegis]